MTNRKVGVIGGGQLAWMMAQEAPDLNLDLVIQTPSPDDPAVALACDRVFAAIDDASATAELAKTCGVITFENEFVDLDALKILENQGVCFRPSISTLQPLLDKYDQRCYLQKIGLPVPTFQSFNLSQPLPFAYPFVLKARRHGYDGQGTSVIKGTDDLARLAPQILGNKWLIEEFIPFERELAIMAARSVTGEIVFYPVVETQQVNQVCHWVMVPAPISSDLQSKIEDYTRLLLTKLNAIGIFGIEFFLTASGAVLINEIAPRTHNSGHYTLDACDISQFALQLQAVTGKSLKHPVLQCQQAVMVNLLGYENAEDDYAEKRAKLAEIPQAFVHLYNKNESRIGRKLGHVTVLINHLDHQNQRQNLLAMIQKIESIWYSTPEGDRKKVKQA
ncbi:MAG: 5-(carboxyamino)imidazole ribonucleotide synthase [Snowella sp.]